MIDIVEFETARTAERAFRREAKVHDSKRYEDWLPFHQALLDVAKRYGRVDGIPDGTDIYYSGDWFDSLTEGFALLTSKPFGKLAFQPFQEVVANHSPFAMFTLVGDLGTEVDGFECIIHSRSVLVAWEGKNREQCREHLASLGLKHETA